MKRDVAVILLHDEKKRILLQHRSEDAERLPGYWAFFCGGIKPGETPEQAVKREAQEELEYILIHPRHVLTQELPEEYGSGTMYVFMEKYDSRKPLLLKEGIGMTWNTPLEARKLKMVKHDREVLEEIAGKY